MNSTRPLMFTSQAFMSDKGNVYIAETCELATGQVQCRFGSTDEASQFAKWLKELKLFSAPTFNLVTEHFKRPFSSITSDKTFLYIFSREDYFLLSSLAVNEQQVVASSSITSQKHLAAVTKPVTIQPPQLNTTPVEFKFVQDVYEQPHLPVDMECKYLDGVYLPPPVHTADLSEVPNLEVKKESSKVIAQPAPSFPPTSSVTEAIEQGLNAKDTETVIKILAEIDRIADAIAAAEEALSLQKAIRLSEGQITTADEEKSVFAEEYANLETLRLKEKNARALLTSTQTLFDNQTQHEQLKADRQEAADREFAKNMLLKEANDEDNSSLLDYLWQPAKDLFAYGFGQTPASVTNDEKTVEKSPAEIKEQKSLLLQQSFLNHSANAQSTTKHIDTDKEAKASLRIPACGFFSANQRATEEQKDAKLRFLFANNLPNVDRHVSVEEENAVVDSIVHNTTIFNSYNNL